jgi:hypothetical protein
MNRLLHSVVSVICGLVLATLALDDALAQRRVALVIGNSAYRNVATLPNTINDANAIAALFRKAGFDIVDTRQDLGVVDFKRAIREFMITSRNAEIAVLYYAGHGIEASGTNYLIPIDAKLATDYDAEDEAVPLDRVILALEPAQRLRLIILDACRDNPFLRKMQRSLAMRAVASGLAKVEPASTDTLIAYAAKAGSVSYDGSGSNSPFTTALIKYIGEPGIDIRIALGRVRDEVLKTTGRRQEPFVYGSLGGTTVSLVPPPEAKKQEPTPVANEGSEVRQAYELTLQVGTKEAWESFIKAYSTGLYADLARAQLAKLTAVTARETAKPAGAKVEADRLALRQRQEEEQRAKRTDIERPQAQPEVAVRPPGKAEPNQQDQACVRDEEQLARLGVNPAREEVMRFARGLACARLRPQVQRLLESSGVGPTTAASKGAPVVGAPAPAAQPSVVQPSPAAKIDEGLRPQAKAEPVQQDRPAARPEFSCTREEERLVRLRANPVREDVIRFARDLGCEALRPQVNRLVESVGGAPAADAPLRTTTAPAGEERQKAERAATEADRHQRACKADEEQLSQLRANPTRAAVARFARQLACEDLRPQLQRLLESLGG